MPLFHRTLEKINNASRDDKVGVLSGACWIILIGFFTALFSTTFFYIYLGIFIAAILFGVKIFKIEEELFKDWVEIPKTFHYGSIVGTIICIPIISKALYVKHGTEHTNNPS